MQKQHFQEEVLISYNPADHKTILTLSPAMWIVKPRLRYSSFLLVINRELFPQPAIRGLLPQDSYPVS